MWILGLKGLNIHFRYLSKSCRFTWSGENSVYTLGPIVILFRESDAKTISSDVEG